MLLVQKDLWDIASRESAYPNGPVTSHVVKCWLMQNCLAVMEIVINVSDSQLQHTHKSNLAAEIWHILHSVHEHAGWAHHISLFQKLFTTMFELTQSSL
jgi:gag-polypeptide of LTR copia-type